MTLTLPERLAGWVEVSPGRYRLTLRDRRHVGAWLNRQITPWSIAR